MVLNVALSNLVLFIKGPDKPSKKKKNTLLTNEDKSLWMYQPADNDVGVSAPHDLYHKSITEIIY